MKCDCGRRSWASPSILVHGGSKTCYWCNRRIKIQVGQRFGKRTVLRLRSRNGHQEAYVRCDCGKKSWTVVSALVRGKRLGCRQCAAVPRRLKIQVGDTFQTEKVLELKHRNFPSQKVLGAVMQCECGGSRWVPVAELLSRKSGCSQCGIARSRAINLFHHPGLTDEELKELARLNQIKRETDGIVKAHRETKRQKYRAQFIVGKKIGPRTILRVSPDRVLVQCNCVSGTRSWLKRSVLVKKSYRGCRRCSPRKGRTMFTPSKIGTIYNGRKLTTIRIVKGKQEWKVECIRCRKTRWMGPWHVRYSKTRCRCHEVEHRQIPFTKGKKIGNRIAIDRRMKYSGRQNNQQWLMLCSCGSRDWVFASRNKSKWCKRCSYSKRKEGKNP
jgi:hypothetical protein